MKTFITGATGFIGGRLIRRLMESGDELHCLVRNNTPAVERLRELGVALEKGDVTDRESVLRGMNGSRRVFHLAGLYSFWEPDRRVFRKINVSGTRNVMECALETGVSKVVHVSTAGIYGKPAENPFSEESPPGPDRFCEYFQTKYEGDLLVWELFRERGLPVAVVYPCVVIGPGDPKASGQYIVDLISRRLPARVMEDAVMTFVHVKDVVEIIIRAAEKPDNTGEKYLAGNIRMSFGELNALVSGISGIPLPMFRLPDIVTRCNAALLTGISRLTGRPPPWGMSVDQIRVMAEGFSVDGSKAERELCIKYTPIRVALEETIASYRG